MSTDQDKAGTPVTDQPAVGTAPDNGGVPEVDLALIDANTAASLGEYTRAWLKRIRNGEAGLLPVIAGLVLIVIIFQSDRSTFLSASNLVALVGEASYYVVFGMAEVFVLLLGEIDLSAGYVAVCGGAITCILASEQHHESWWISALAGVILCTLIGFIQGLLVTRLRLPSFVVTLGGLLAFEGFLLFMLNSWSGKQTGGTVAITNSILTDLVNGTVSPKAGWIVMTILVIVYAVFVLGRDRRRRASGLVSQPLGLAILKIVGVAIAAAVLVAVCNSNSTGRVGFRSVGGVPWSVFIILGLVIAATFFLGRTRFGRYVYAVGGNAEAARRAGINVNRIRLLCFSLTGLVAGFAGLFYVSNLQSISTSVDGGQLVLYAVAAAVIGGTSLFGGRGKIVHAVIGGLVIATIYNGMALISLGADAQDIVTALVLVAAATVDALARRGRTTA